MTLGQIVTNRFRRARVECVKFDIECGTYETPAKLDAALDRMLDGDALISRDTDEMVLPGIEDPTFTPGLCERSSAELQAEQDRRAEGVEGAETDV